MSAQEHETTRTAPSTRTGVLVTGLPRSGTSWVGKMLEAGGELVYVNEPLNPQHPPGHSPGVLNAEVEHWYHYICQDNEEQWLRAFTDTLALRYHPLAEIRRNHKPYDFGRLAKYYNAFAKGRRKGQRALLDDPYGMLSAAWFAKRLGCRVVILVRHPVSLVGSWQKLGWEPSLPDLLAQPLLMRDMLGPYEGEIRAAIASGDPVEQTAVLWRVTYAAMCEVVENIAPEIHVQRYEDLASDPVNAFSQVYQACGLTFSHEARQTIVAATTGGGTAEKSHEWSLKGGVSRTAYRPMDSRSSLTSYRDRLSPEQIARVTELTAEVAKRYYDDGEHP
ncbi:MAG TPA: sulfotransferase domain-containing protein [Streptosporangiaceae bacterium]|nr:sulfotransferase domain-containing protein [Streptosporangiaceae bacterium]